MEKQRHWPDMLRCNFLRGHRIAAATADIIGHRLHHEHGFEVPSRFVSVSQEVEDSDFAEPSEGDLDGNLGFVLLFLVAIRAVDWRTERQCPPNRLISRLRQP